MTEFDACSRGSIRARGRWPPGLRESALRPHASTRSTACRREGIYDIRGFGAKRRLPHFDDLLLLGASVSRYPLEGYRERCATDVVLGTRFANEPVQLEIPITIAGMSFGALSAPAKEALGRGATAVGTSTTTGDGGMMPEEREPPSALVYQVLPSRYGLNPDDLRRADAIEVVVGQGAKPGGGGMLLGQKITARVAAMRDLPVGIDQRSACRHPDWTGPDDLEIKIRELREITDWQKPIYVKVGATRTYYDVALAVKSGRRRGRGRRHAGRHGGEPGGVHRACRHPDPRRDPGGGALAAGAGHAPQGAADRLGRHPHRRRRRQGAGAGRRRGLDRRRLAGRARRQRARVRARTTRRSAPRPATTTTGTRAATRSGSPPRTTSSRAASTPSSAAGGWPTTCGRWCWRPQTLARACGKSHVHNLEPEDLVALTVEAAAMAKVPLAGTDWVPGRDPT